MVVTGRALETEDDFHRPPVQRLGLGQAVRDTQQHRQVVEADGEVGVVGPYDASSIASARRYSGSGSATRLVA